MAEYLIPHPNVPTTDMGIPKLKESTMLFNENFLALDDQVRTNTSEIVSLASSKADADHTHDYDYAEKDHTHSIQEIESLEANLSLKAPLVHTHEQYLTEMPAHTHDQNEITNLQLDLSGKASAQHTHLIDDVSGLGSELAQKATQQQLGQVANMIVPAYGTLTDGKFVAAKVYNSKTYIETPDEQPVATTGTTSNNHIVSFEVSENTVKIKDSGIDKDDILTTDNIGNGLQVTTQVTTEDEAPTVSVKCAEDGGLSVSDNGVAIAAMTGSKWVKTDSDGMLTTTDAEPITASKSETGFIFNTTGTISHKSFGTSAGDVSRGNHNHDEKYADINHTHDEYQEKSEKLTKLNTALDDNGKVPLTQLTGNIPDHSGTCYVTIENDGTLGHSGNTAYTLLNDAAKVSEVSKLLTDKDVGTTENTVAAGNHTHEDEYAAIDHDHDGVYSPVDHVHEIYALVEHNHDGVYAGVGHNHDTTYATISHTHSQYAETDDLGDAAYQDIGVGVQAHSDKLDDVQSYIDTNGKVLLSGIKGDIDGHSGDCLVTINGSGVLGHSGNKAYTLVNNASDATKDANKIITDKDIGNGLEADATSHNLMVKAKSGGAISVTSEGVDVNVSGTGFVKSDNGTLSVPTEQPITLPEGVTNITSGNISSYAVSSVNNKTGAVSVAEFPGFGGTGSAITASHSDHTHSNYAPSSTVSFPGFGGTGSAITASHSDHTHTVSNITDLPTEFKTAVNKQGSLNTQIVGISGNALVSKDYIAADSVTVTTNEVTPLSGYFTAKKIDATKVGGLTKNKVVETNDSGCLTASSSTYSKFNSTPAGSKFVKTSGTDGTLAEDDFEGLSDDDPQDVGQSASSGTANTAARSDHIHKLPIGDGLEVDSVTLKAKCKSNGGIKATSDGLALDSVGTAQESTGFIEQTFNPERLSNVVKIHWPRFDSNGRFVDFGGAVTTIDYFPGGIN